MSKSFMLLAALVLSIPPTARGEGRATLEAGNYLLYFGVSYAAPEQAISLLQVEKKGGELRAVQLDRVEQLPIEMGEFKVEGSRVEIGYDLQGRAMSFEGVVDAKDRHLVLGSFGDDRLVARARLVHTDRQKLVGDDLRLPPQNLSELTKAAQMIQNVQRLRMQLQRAKGPEQAELKAQLKAAEDALSEEGPTSLRQVLEKSPDSPVALAATILLLGLAEKRATPEEAKAWVKNVEKIAAPYGARFELDALIRCAGALKSQKGFSEVSEMIAADADKLSTPRTPTMVKARLQEALLASYQASGKTNLARQAELQLKALNDEFDREYLAKVPPFKPRTYAGRDNPVGRVAAVELFTGAQCPPCVAADVAFDALQKSFKPVDAVFMEYHLHVPAPDALTCPVSEERAEYYKVRGTPSLYLNGKPQPRMGGGMTDAEAKYKALYAAIEPLLTESKIGITGAAITKDDKVQIHVQVNGLNDANKDVKLRLLLVEETIKYAGGNGIRFYHHVVRDMPGGADGIKAADAAKGTDFTVDLATLRSKLGQYLTEFNNATEFPNAERPLDLKNMRVIALVQDDTSGEVLQARQLDGK